MTFLPVASRRHTASAIVGRILTPPPDHEPSPARSSYERPAPFKLIPRRLCGRTRCEPGTARGPFLVGRPALWRQCRDVPVTVLVVCLGLVATCRASGL